MNFIVKHWPYFLALYVVISTAVDAMDEPTPADSSFYRWFYRFAHGVAFNLVTAFGKIGRTPWPGEISGEGVKPTPGEIPPPPAPPGPKPLMRAG